jgi:hypothetical protein
MRALHLKRKHTALPLAQEEVAFVPASCKLLNIKEVLN